MNILDNDFQPDHINVDSTSSSNSNSNSNSNSTNNKFHSAKDHMNSNRKPSKRPSVDVVNEIFQKKVIFKSIIFQPI